MPFRHLSTTNVRRAVGLYAVLATLCLVVSHTCLPSAGAAGNVLFSDGFETGTRSAWSGSNSTGRTSSVAVTPAAAYAGGFGLDTSKLGTNDNGHAEVYKTLTAPASKVLSLRSRLRIVSRQGAGALYFQRLYRTGPIFRQLVALHYDGVSYTLRMRRLDGSEPDVALASQLAAGTWYDVELVYDWSGTHPVASAYVNGVLSATITDTSAGTRYAPDSAYVGLFEDGWTQQAEAQWDAVSVADGVQSSAGGSPTSTPTPSPTTTVAPG